MAMVTRGVCANRVNLVPVPEVFMIFRDRPDGELVKNASLLRRIMPFVMPSRNESVIYYEHDLDLTETLGFIERQNKNKDRDPFTFFHVVLAAGVRVLALRQNLNRFIVGGRLYQRSSIDLSFVVKKAMTDRAPMTTVKVTFEPTDTLEDVARRANEAIGVGRGDERTASEKEMSLVSKLPSSLIGPMVKLQKLADRWNLLPGSMIRNDPLYASVFLANLGSIGIESPFHHLYEYGTISLFIAIGKIRKEVGLDGGGKPVKRDVVTMRYTFDERVADGFYCARSLEMYKGLIEHPSSLLDRPEHLPKPMDQEAAPR